MEENVTAQADFIGYLAIVLVVVWLAGAAVIAMAPWWGANTAAAGAAPAQTEAPAQ
jgi:hypothetical protein